MKYSNVLSDKVSPKVQELMDHATVYRAIENKTWVEHERGIIARN